MPEVTVAFDDTEMAVVRAAAQQAGQPVNDYVHAAVLQHAMRGKEHVAAAAEKVAQRSAVLNRRLGEQ